MKPTERFSEKVENYVKYRPHYPPEIIPFLEKEICLFSNSIIADIGSGTGISAEMFLKNGNTVYGIEPNKAMREAGEKLLEEYSKFHSIEATAEATTLPDKSIDLIVAGQAFHWFDVLKAKDEFKRILKPSGWVTLIWNERSPDSTPFLVQYERLLNEFGTDYPVVKHTNILDNIKTLFEPTGFQLMEFPNSQSFDYSGLEGRLLSSSYIPRSDHPMFQPMLAELWRIFDENKKDELVEILYQTEVYYGKLL